MQDLWVNQLMTKAVSTCKRETPLHQVVDQLHQQSFSCLVITDDNQAPLGIITERDMVTILADLMSDVSWDGLAIENFMSTPPICVAQDATLLEAMELIRSKSIRHAPVVNMQGKLTGILTQSDIVEGLYQTMSEFVLEAN